MDRLFMYRSYLLRLWCVDDAGASVWRASLEDAETGERIGFSDLQQLFTFIEAEGAAATRSADEVNPGAFIDPV